MMQWRKKNNEESPSARPYEKPVAKGIVLLDKYGPDDWRERIDLQTLAFPDLTRCVLGQLYGRFTRGWSALEKSGSGRWVRHFNGGPRDHGFVSSGKADGDYPELTAEWKRQLAQTKDTER